MWGFRRGWAGGWVKTGLISLATEPSGASVYLGNRRYTQKTPTVLRDLLPGDYPVKLVLKDRQPWTRTVSVDAEKATVLERVLLLPRALTPRIILAGPFEQFTPVPNTRLVLLTAGPRASNVTVYDLEEEQVQLKPKHGTIAQLTLEDRRHALKITSPVELTGLSPKTLLTMGERGELLANQAPYRVAEKGVLGIEPDVARQRALVWRKNALGIVRVTDDVVDLQWVFTRGSRIEQAFWVYEDSHALFRDGDRVWLLELETYGTPEPRELIRVARRSPVMYVEETGALYYLDDEGALAGLNILPKRELLEP